MVVQCGRQGGSQVRMCFVGNAGIGWRPHVGSEEMNASPEGP